MRVYCADTCTGQCTPMHETRMYLPTAAADTTAMNADTHIAQQLALELTARGNRQLKPF